MILRRVTEHVKAQNWTAVALDFVIVVLGVFIGVQIGNGNETRQQRALYEQSFDRMIVELQTNLLGLEDLREDLRKDLALVQPALDDLRACHTGPDARARVQASFAPIRRGYAMKLDTTALDQLINNEQFLPFQSPDLRNRLLGLAKKIKQAHASAADVAAVSDEQDFADGLTEKGPLVYSGPDEIADTIMSGVTQSPELVRETRLKAPLAEACRDERVLKSYYVWEDNVYYQSIFAKIMAARLRDELAALGHPAEDADEPGVEK